MWENLILFLFERLNGTLPRSEWLITEASQLLFIELVDPS
jgi:hypothetical protein